MEDVKRKQYPFTTQATSIMNYINKDLDKKMKRKYEEKLREQELQRRMQAYTTRNEPIIRRNAERQQHRAEGGQTDADEQLPPVPTLPDGYDPFTAEQRAPIAAYTEAFKDYSRALQYTLTKVTKNEPHRFVLQCNHNKLIPADLRLGDGYTSLTSYD
eukprot:5706516-Amphidinium_carterae.1